MIHVLRGCSAWRYPCCKSFTAKLPKKDAGIVYAILGMGPGPLEFEYYEDILKKTLCIYCPQIKIL